VAKGPIQEKILIQGWKRKLQKSSMYVLEGRRQWLIWRLQSMQVLPTKKQRQWMVELRATTQHETIWKHSGRVHLFPNWLVNGNLNFYVLLYITNFHLHFYIHLVSLGEIDQTMYHQPQNGPGSVGPQQLVQQLNHQPNNGPGSVGPQPAVQQLHPQQGILPRFGESENIWILVVI